MEQGCRQSLVKWFIFLKEKRVIWFNIKLLNFRKLSQKKYFYVSTSPEYYRSLKGSVPINFIY